MSQFLWNYFPVLGLLTYNGNQKTEIIYDKENKLSQKNLYILDAKGNVIQETSIAISKGGHDEQSAYSYDEFDAQGNWIKRSAIKPVIKEGKSIQELQSTQSL